MPCRNEAESIDEMLVQIQKSFSSFEDKLYVYICFVNDHSLDDSWQVIQELSNATKTSNHKKVKFEVLGLNLENQNGKSHAQALGIRAVAGICEYVIV